MADTMLSKLLDDDHTAEAETSIPLDEDAAMQRIAIALNALDAEEDFLSESQSIIKLNKQAKTNNLAHRQALLLAKSKNDPMYAKYAKFNGIRLQIREVIYRKYGSKALSRARQLMAGNGTSNVKK